MNGPQLRREHFRGSGIGDPLKGSALLMFSWSVPEQVQNGRLTLTVKSYLLGSEA